MQYKVPQDVQREDTIIGPLTLKQLGILGIGGAITYTIYVSLAKSYFMEIWLPPIIVTSSITLAFAFLKVHNLPFYQFIMYFIEYHTLARQRVWIQGTGTPYISSLEKLIQKKTPKKQEGLDGKPKKTIEELTNIVDTGGNIELSKEEKKENLQKIINHEIK